MIRKMARFEESYFKKYAGSGKHYLKVWKDHSYADAVIAQFKSPASPKLKTMCVLGTGPGPILDVFQKSFPKLKIYGCEMSDWAFARLSYRWKRRVGHVTMQKYLRDCVRSGKIFDLSFSNSLIYLEKKDLDGVLDSLSKCTRFLHFNCSFRGKACPDPERKILERFEWWDKKIIAAGFVALKGHRGHHTYLWESTKFRLE